MLARLAIWGFIFSVLTAALPARAAQPMKVLATPAAVTVPAGVPDAPAPLIQLTKLGRYIPQGVELDKSAAEIVSFDPATDRMFIANGLANTIDVVNIANPIMPTLAFTIPIAPNGATSVAVKNGIVVAAVPANPKSSNGSVAFFNTDGALLNSVSVGALPDMITFTPDGRKVLIANEGEPSSYNQVDSIDPEGSISIIDISSGVLNATVQTAGFTSFNAISDTLRAEGVRIFGPNATVAQDLEPEYITISPDSATAYVTLQENNALAVINLATATVSDIIPLGFKDHSLPGNGLDASDREAGATGTISITTRPVLGLYMPDSIASYTAAAGGLYLVTANEGDAREYVGFPGGREDPRLSSLTFDPTVPNSATLKTNAQLGRLRISLPSSDTDGDGDIDRVVAFGARSFSILDASSGALVYDSGDDIEVRTSQIYSQTFNTDHTVNTLDSRSPAKGPEPEAATVGTINGRTYAFIGLERMGGIMVYDVTVPTAPTFVQYVNNRNFGVTPSTATVADGTAGDLGPEGFSFVKAGDSPTGKPLLLVANEVSGSTTIYEIGVISAADGAGSLSLLHNNDGESTLQPLDVQVNPNTAGYSSPLTQTVQVAGVAAFKAVTEREISDARNLGNAVVNVYAGDAFLASAALQCSLDNPTGPVYDAIAQAAIPYTAHVLGHHEFDYSPDFLKRFIDAFGGTQPFLSTNLDFSGEPSFAPLVDADGVLFSPLVSGDKVLGGSLVYTDTVTNQRFGIVGLTTPLLPTISTPRGIAVTPTITETATAAQAAIDELYNDLGVRKIILVSHLQDLRNNRDLIKRLKKVDIAVAGGGDGLLTNPNIANNIELLPGDVTFKENNQDVTYPLIEKDADNRDVYIVTTNGNYKYVGRLDVNFDANGEVAGIVSEESYPRRVVEASAAATAIGISDAVTPDAGLVASVVTPIDACLDVYANTPVVRSEVTLDVSRDGVRSRETNAGNLIADGFLDAYKKYADNVGVTVPITRVVAVQNGGGIRQNAGNLLPKTGVPGLLSRLETINVLPFDNFVSVVRNVTPAELKAILERSASGLPGQGGQFLQIGGMKVAYNLRNPAQVVANPPTGEVAGNITTAGSRVVNVTLNDGTKIIENGAVVVGAPNVAIVTNNFTARGGDNYATFEDKAASTKVNLVDDDGIAISYEQAWREYLLSFPVSGSPSLPTIAASDGRYKVGGEGRIVLLRSLFLPMLFTLAANR